MLGAVKFQDVVAELSGLWKQNTVAQEHHRFTSSPSQTDPPVTSFRIPITTNLLFPDSTSVISASSQLGQQGTIIIQSPISPASGKIVPLGQKPLLAITLLSQRCAALAGGHASSFTVAGRDGVPV